MVHYKLTYFPMRGIAETARQLFALAKVDYEDVRIDREKFADHKSSAPFGQVPWLEVDGIKLGQSLALIRYLAKKFGYAGKDDWDSAQIDAYGDQFFDFFGEIKAYLPVMAGLAKGDKDKLLKEIVEPARDKLFSLLVKQLKENKTGYLVGSISWLDLLLASHVETFSAHIPGYVDKYPELSAHLKKVHAIPEIKKWIEKRPKTDF